MTIAGDAVRSQRVAQFYLLYIREYSKYSVRRQRDNDTVVDITPRLFVVLKTGHLRALCVFVGVSLTCRDSKSDMF